MTAPLFVEPVFKERVWGGTTLREVFGDIVPPGTMGEAWIISGMPCNAGSIVSGPGTGTTLDAAWRDGLVTGQPRSDDFPILVKVLDPTDWLSVQVHPNDEQAQALEGQPRGKAECWYVISSVPGAELIIGHDASTATELRGFLEDGKLDDHLLRQQVQEGSFFMVPAGCVHAVGPGMLVYEVQQSSDITYRLYDFERSGLDGEPRELHVEKGFSVVAAPYDPTGSLTSGGETQVRGGVTRSLVSGNYFSVDVLSPNPSLEAGQPDRFRLLSVVRGTGELIWDGGSATVSPITSVVLPVGCRATVSGGLDVIITSQAA